MKRIDRILAVVDPTAETQPGVAKAARIAAACSATLELYVCDYDPALTGEPFFDTDRLRQLRAEFLEERNELVEALAVGLIASGLTVETHVHWDHPLHDGILNRAAECKPDLIVKDTHHHSVIQRTLLTNTDWHLIRGCRAPLLLANASPWPEHPLLLAALDPEHTGEKPAALDDDLLDYGVLFAAKLGGELHAAHAFFPATLLAAVGALGGMPGGLPGLPGDGGAGIVQAERSRVGAALEVLTGPHGLPAQRVHLEQGSAVDALPALVGKLGAQLLLMGAVSRSRLERAFIGSTAERVLDRLPCDVLIVKPPDFPVSQPL